MACFSEKGRRPVDEHHRTLDRQAVIVGGHAARRLADRRGNQWPADALDRVAMLY